MTWHHSTQARIGNQRNQSSSIAGMTAARSNEHDKAADSSVKAPHPLFLGSKGTRRCYLSPDRAAVRSRARGAKGLAQKSGAKEADWSNKFQSQSDLARSDVSTEYDHRDSNSLTLHPSQWATPLNGPLFLPLLSRSPSASIRDFSRDARNFILKVRFYKEYVSI
jgi:hypothetical protein